MPYPRRVPAPCRVVICDDQPAFRKTVGIVLGLDDGVEVVGQAANGQEAVDVVGDLRPDVCLLDIAMPVLDGLAALPLIRAASPDTRVVMLTGVTTDAVRRRALDSGAVLFVEKGTGIDVLARQIKEVCAA